MTAHLQTWPLAQLPLLSENVWFRRLVILTGCTFMGSVFPCDYRISENV